MTPFGTFNGHRNVLNAIHCMKLWNSRCCQVVFMSTLRHLLGLPLFWCVLDQYYWCADVV